MHSCWNLESRALLENVASTLNDAIFDVAAQRCEALCDCISLILPYERKTFSESSNLLRASEFDALNQAAKQILNELSDEVPCSSTKTPILCLIDGFLDEQIDLQQSADRTYRIEALFKTLLNVLMGNPARRLACYGSLRRTEKNHHVVADIPGKWYQGTIKGFVFKWNNYPIFNADSDGAEIVVDVLESEALAENFERLDEFEGTDYQRNVVVVAVNDTLLFSNVYSGRVD